MDAKLLAKWGKRRDVQKDQLPDGDVLLRFGKGGGVGRDVPQASYKPYPYPAWVAKKIARQKARLAEEARLKRYG